MRMYNHGDKFPSYKCYRYDCCVRYNRLATWFTAGTHSSKILHTKDNTTFQKSARLVRLNDQVKGSGFQWNSLQAALRHAEAQQKYKALAILPVFIVDMLDHLLPKSETSSTDTSMQHIEEYLRSHQ